MVFAFVLFFFLFFFLLQTYKMTRFPLILYQIFEVVWRSTLVLKLTVTAKFVSLSVSPNAQWSVRKLVSTTICTHVWNPTGLLKLVPLHIELSFFPGMVTLKKCMKEDFIKMFGKIVEPWGSNWANDAVSTNAKDMICSYLEFADKAVSALSTWLIRICSWAFGAWWIRASPWGSGSWTDGEQGDRTIIQTS